MGIWKQKSNQWILWEGWKFVLNNQLYLLLIKETLTRKKQWGYQQAETPEGEEDVLESRG